MNLLSEEFLIKHNMDPRNIQPDIYSDIFAEHMRSGLSGKIIDMPMIPTYLKATGELRQGENIIVIDAGGTNFRCGLANYNGNEIVVSNVNVCKMPGVKSSVTWEEFIAFVVDKIETFLPNAASIGFCFSYSAEITPDCDGIVNVIDKEVSITGCEHKLIGESINEELAKRGYSTKRVVILNDTVAALFGGSSIYRQNDYSHAIGMICGTGFNICIPYDNMIYNMEAGFFNSMPFGDFDQILDKSSIIPGEKRIEKMISGAYLGSLCKLMIKSAAEEGYISESCYSKLESIGTFASHHADEYAAGNDILGLTDNSKDLDFIRDLCNAAFERAARCAATAIIGIMKFLGNCSNVSNPAAFFSEGSLISKSTFFKDYLESVLKIYAEDLLNLHCRIIVGVDTTLPGSAKAALLNS